MAEQTFCGNCGASIDEPASIPVNQRQSCPLCGSTRRNFSMEVHDSIAFSATATATVITYPSALLTIAGSLIQQGHFNIAIVTSHMACEVAAERAFDALFASKNLEALGVSVQGLMNGRNLGNEKHRDLYNALAHTKIEEQLFWPNFQNASKKRNSIIHRGGQANKNEAETALQAARELIAYLKQL